MTPLCAEVPVRINWSVWTRKWHRWASALVALPFLLVLVTGILLQLKKEWAWVQPPTTRGKGNQPTLSFERILAAARSVPEAEVRTWADVDRVDVRPDRGIAKVRCKNSWEVQVDLTTGEVLQVAYRRSDLIESLHDGSFFHDGAKVWVFLPVALVLLTLLGTGVYLFVLPLAVRWSRARRAARKSAALPAPEQS